MASFVTAADALTAAVEIEKRGRDFYLRAQEKSTNPVAIELFRVMADEELKHEHIFAEMLQRVGGKDIPIGSADAEYLTYIQNSLDSYNLFADDVDTSGNPFNLAVWLEKDSIIYYLSMIDLVPDSEKPLIQACIDEEKKHIRMIYQYKNQAGLED